MARHRPHEARLAGIVIEHPPDGPDCLAQRAVRHDDVPPDVVEDVAPMHGLMPALDEENEQIEIARNQWYLVLTSQQRSSPRGEHEVVETVARHAAAMLAHVGPPRGTGRTVA